MIKQQFEISAGYKKWTNILLGVGGLALVLGIIFLGMSKDGHTTTYKNGDRWSQGSAHTVT